MHEKKGLSPYWVEVDLGEKGIWFRIFAGYFLNKAKAEAYIDEKQITDAKSKSTKYANLIGVYHSQHELNRKRVSLSKLGYSPYVVAGVNGESLLYTGAFYQRARADKQHTQLASRGIRSRVVMR
jgi:cell division septation protein DedD